MAKSDELSQQIEELDAREQELEQAEQAATSPPKRVEIRYTRLGLAEKRAQLVSAHENALETEARETAGRQAMVAVRESNAGDVARIEAAVKAYQAECDAVTAGFDNCLFAQQEAEIRDLARRVRDLKNQGGNFHEDCARYGIAPPAGMRITNKAREYAKRVGEHV